LGFIPRISFPRRENIFSFTKSKFC